MISWEQLAKTRQEELQKLNTEYLEQSLRQSQTIAHYQNKIAELEAEKEAMSDRLDELELNVPSDIDVASTLTDSTLPLINEAKAIGLTKQLDNLNIRLEQIEALCSRLIEENKELKTLLLNDLQPKQLLPKEGPVSEQKSEELIQKKGESTQAGTPTISVPPLKEHSYLNGEKPTNNGQVRLIGNKDDTLKTLISKNMPSEPTLNPTLLNRTFSSTARSSFALHNSDEFVKDYAGKVILGYSFNKRYYKVSHWIELLTGVLNTLSKTHHAEIGKCLQLQGVKGNYFSRNSTHLRLPRIIDGTNIYFETNLSANQIVRLCYKLIDLFGYSNSALTIDCRTGK